MTKNTATAAAPDASTETGAPQAPKSNVLLFDPSKIKVTKQVSTNLLKLRPGNEVYIKITGAMEIAKALKKQSAEDAKKEPPTLLPVINLQTGEVQSIIVGSVLKDLLNDEYPQNKYVGRGFWITVKEQKDAKAGGGRRYNNYDVKEIELPEHLRGSK